MRKVQAALKLLTPHRDGVDGAGLYLYGEAWDFGEMACNRRGRNACQLNIYGLGIGSFNDRFRDAVLGGTPFQDPRQQGITTGLATDMRMDFDQGGTLDQLERLMEYSDWLRLSMVGGLRDYMMEDRFGRTVKGMQVRWHCSPLMSG
jgi:pullulanase